MNEILNDISKEIIKFNNKEVKVESLKEYLKAFNVKELKSYATLYLTYESMSKNLNKIKDIVDMKKDELINYIIKHINDIAKFYYIISDNNIKKEIIKISKDNLEDKIIFDIKNINTIMFLKDNYIAKVQYLENDNKVKIFIPKEIASIFIKLSTDKKIIKESNIYNDLNNFTDLVLNVYGIVILEVLMDLYEEYYPKMDDNRFIDLLNISSITNGSYQMIFDGEDILISGLDFDNEEHIINFYENQQGYYHHYSIEELQDIYTLTYLKNMDEYIELYNYIESIFEECDGLDEDLEFIVSDFIYQAQINMENAIKAVKSHLKKILDLEKEEIEYSIKLLIKIFDNYPKWIKKGNI